jgi:hypothetical protein
MPKNELGGGFERAGARARAVVRNFRAPPQHRTCPSTAPQLKRVSAAVSGEWTKVWVENPDIGNCSRYQKKQGATGITAVAPRIAGQWGRGDNRLPELRTDPKVVPAPDKFFWTRLSDNGQREPPRSVRVVSFDRYGARDERIMSQLSRGLFAATAVLVMCGVGGAVQFAAGHDLSVATQNFPGTSESSINRAAKADRAARLPEGAIQTRAVSVRLYGLSDTSVVVRIPVAREARNGPSAPLVTKSGDRRSGDRKMTVACEPVVSVLTEIARQLQPGRCVT